MLTKETYDAIKREIASLDKQAADISMTRAILAQALGLDESAALPHKQEGKKRKTPNSYTRTIFLSNRQEIIDKIRELLEKQDSTGAEIHSYLAKKGIDLTQKSLASLMPRLCKEGVFKLSIDSTPRQNIYHVVK